MKTDTSKLWVITGNSESSDSVGPFVLDHEPNKEEQIKAIKSIGEDIGQDGPGLYGSYVYLRVSKVEMNNVE